MHISHMTKLFLMVAAAVAAPADLEKRRCSTWEHTIKSGDTCWGLSQFYHIPLNQVFPPPGQYVVSCLL
jgi:hypothetical protein